MRKIISNLVFAFLMCNFSLAQTGWYSLASGTTANLWDVYFLDTVKGYVVGDTGKILQTTNGGINWSNQTTGITDGLRSIQFLNENVGYTCGYSGKILKTTNGGLNWSSLNSGTSVILWSIFMVDTNIGYVVGGYQAIVLKTTNGGNNWTVKPTGVNGTFYTVFCTSGDTAYIGGASGLIMKTTNGGDNWVFQFNPYSQPVLGVYFANSNTGYLVGASLFNTMLARTTNGGQNWNYLTPPTGNNNLNGAFCLASNSVYAIGGSGIILRTINGTTWISQSSGTTNTLWSVFFVNQSVGYVAGWNGTILKTTTGGIVGIGEVIGKVSDKFALHQNYPNPFNPNTKIRFQIPVGDAYMRPVQLIVYDILGREIATLVNEELNQGKYEAAWDASNQPSGVYYYKLSAGEYSETKKMILVK